MSETMREVQEYNHSGVPPAPHSYTYFYEADRDGNAKASLHRLFADPRFDETATPISIAEFMQGEHSIDELTRKDKDKILNDELREEIDLQTRLAKRLYPKLDPESNAFEDAVITIRLYHTYHDGCRYWWIVGKSLLTTSVYHRVNGEWKVRRMKSVDTL